MKFECGDLERALAVAELMPEARVYLKICAVCRKEFRLWNEISVTARSLHEEWETPLLWANIKVSIEAEPRPKETARWMKNWRAWAVAAAVLVALGLAVALPVWRTRFATRTEQTSETAPQIATTSGNSDFLTDQALAEVERTEAAYRQSIERLSRFAQPRIEH